MREDLIGFFIMNRIGKLYMAIKKTFFWIVIILGQVTLIQGQNFGLQLQRQYTVSKIFPWLKDAEEARRKIVSCNNWVQRANESIAMRELPNHETVCPTKDKVGSDDLRKILRDIQNEEIVKIQIEPISLVAEENSQENLNRIMTQILEISKLSPSFKESKSLEVALQENVRIQKENIKQLQTANRGISKILESCGVFTFLADVICSEGLSLMNQNSMNIGIMSEIINESERKLLLSKENNANSKTLLLGRIDELVNAVISRGNSLSEKMSQERQKLEIQSESLRQQGRELENLAFNRDSLIKPDINQKKEEINNLNNELNSVQSNINSSNINLTSIRRANRRLKEDIEDESIKRCGGYGNHYVTNEICVLETSKTSRRKIKDWNEKILTNNSSITELENNIKNLEQNKSRLNDKKNTAEQKLKELQELLKEIEQNYKSKIEKRRKESEQYFKDRKILDQLSKLLAQNSKLHSEVVTLKINLLR